VEKKNGKIITEYQFYKDSNIIAEKSFKDENEHTNKRVAFDKNGKQIAEVTVEPINTYIDGKVIFFDTDNRKNITNNENILAEGIHQNGYPYSGTFYNHIIKSYQEGILEGEKLPILKVKLLLKE